MARKDPLRNFRFRVDIDGITQAGFSEVTGFDSTVDPIDYREGKDPTHVRKLTGLTKYGPITLKWGVTDSKDLHDWHQKVIDGTIDRKNIKITLIDEAGADKASWNISEAWPSKYHAADLNAKGNDVAIETMEIMHEGVKRAK